MADEERVEAGGKPVDLKKRREELQAAKANLKDAKRETAERISVLLDQYAEVGDASIKLAADMGRDLVTQARTGIDRQISSRVEGFRGAMTEYGDASDLMDKITARRQYIADHARAYKVDPTQDKTSRVVSTAQRIQNFAKRGVMQGVLKSARTLDAAHAILFGKKEDRVTAVERAARFGERYMQKDAPIMRDAKKIVEVQKHIRKSQETSDMFDKASGKRLSQTVDERTAKDAEYSKAHAGRSKAVLSSVDQIKRLSARKDAIIADGVRRVSGFAGRTARLFGAKDLARQMENRGLSLAKRRASRDSRSGKAAEALANGIFKTKDVTFAVAGKVKDAAVAAKDAVVKAKDDTIQAAKDTMEAAAGVIGDTQKAVKKHIRTSIESADRTTAESMEAVDAGYIDREAAVDEYVANNATRNSTIVSHVASTNLDAVDFDRKVTTGILKVSGFFAKGANLIGAKKLAKNLMANGKSLSQKISTRKPIRGTAAKYMASGLFWTHDVTLQAGRDAKQFAKDTKEAVVQGAQELGEDVKDAAVMVGQGVVKGARATKEGAVKVGKAAVGLGVIGVEKGIEVGKETVKTAQELPGKVGRGMRKTGFASLSAIITGIREARKSFRSGMEVNMAEIGEPMTFSEFMAEQNKKGELIRNAIPDSTKEKAATEQQQTHTKQTQREDDELVQ